MTPDVKAGNYKRRQDDLNIRRQAMRQYLYVFWALVLGGMVMLTVIYPPGTQYAGYRNYQVYDRDGNMTLIAGHDYTKSIGQRF